MTTYTFVPEVGRYLMPVELQIWNGELLHPTLCKYYQDLWRAEFAARLGVPVAVTAPAPVATTAIPLNVIARPNRCEHLQSRVEFKTGCSGWRCLHECSKGLPAVPGILCQTCEQYEDSGEKF